MTSTISAPPSVPIDPPLHEQVASATALLESIAGNRALLTALTDAQRIRLIQAAGQVYSPDATQRRHLVKATQRRSKAAKVEREEAVLSGTGIRKLRQQTVFTTPNVFVPEDFEQRDVEDPDFREALEPQHCYVCKQDFTRIHHFYDQLCPACAELNFASARRPPTSADVWRCSPAVASRSAIRPGSSCCALERT